MRTALGIAACVLYAWRVYDPKGSYAAFYDVSNWLTGWLLQGDGVMAGVRNVVNLVLLDQAEGFLLGIAFLAALSLPAWAVRKGCGWCWRRLRRRLREPAPLDLGPPIAPAPPPVPPSGPDGHTRPS